MSSRPGSCISQSSCARILHTPTRREKILQQQQVLVVSFFFRITSTTGCVFVCVVLRLSESQPTTFFYKSLPLFYFLEKKKILNKREDIEFKRPSCCEMNVLDLWSPWTGSQPNRKDLLSWPSFGSK